LKEFDEIRLYGKQEELLRQIKFSTIDKLLEEKRDISKKEYGLSGTKRSPLLKTLIPVRTNFNKEETQEPGHVEMDCVLRCGESLSGQYAETLNVLDIYSSLE
ncbi:transposase, partial [Candidatus Roizmanbacteria bacterium CG_4_9_14_0_8_um_filter_34_12]